MLSHKNKRTRDSMIGTLCSSDNDDRKIMPTTMTGVLALSRLVPTQDSAEDDWH
jgi:hypothetical protein